ncbi:peptidase inhibitor family I36 protein [Streptomyces sp. NPDC046988]|uniref:peptidase inhibitor family I36 protein n=1 Tax=Streptomyces sp. NPDC046988 TaxID=3154922 RepID=UPI0034096D80
MFSPKTKLRTAAVVATAAVALTGLGAGTASAADWPPLQEGAYLYSGTGGTGTVTEVDLGDHGTCHALSRSAKSIQVANGSASVVVYSGAGCTGSAWASGSLAQSDLPAPALSYRVVPA